MPLLLCIFALYGYIGIGRYFYLSHQIFVTVKNAIYQKEQINCFLNPKWNDENQRTRTIWSDETIQQCLVIWTTSKQAYRYLYKNRIIPLPSESVLTERLRLVCPKLFFCKQLSLVVNKYDQRTMKIAIRICLAFQSFQN